MRINEYPSITDLDSSNVFVTDGTNGTKQISGSDLTYALFDPIPEMHNNIYRGKDLGSSFTSAQKSAISDGSFHDLWLGDYWTSGSTKYRIVDFDYFYGAQSEINDTVYKNDKHHIVIMPSRRLSTSTTSGDMGTKAFDYRSSNMKSSSALSGSSSTISSFFGSSNIYQHVDRCTYNTTNGDSNNICQAFSATFLGTVEIPEIWQIFPSAGVVAGTQLGIVGRRTFAAFNMVGNPITILSEVADSGLDYGTVDDTTIYRIVCRTPTFRWRTSDGIYVPGFSLISGFPSTYQVDTELRVLPYACING